MLTVSEVGERFGLTRREALRRIRSLERTTGRRILMARGEGHGRRHLIDSKALSEALEGVPAQVAPEVAGIDDLAAEIARTVSDMDARHTEMSIDLRETKKRLALAEEQIRNLLARLARR